jgi:hypothetical protein
MHIRWDTGGEAQVTLLNGEQITVVSSTPSAPGSRPAGVLQSGARLKIKVARCKRHDALFVIEGRLIDTVRETRGQIQRLVDPPAP